MNEEPKNDNNKIQKTKTKVKGAISEDFCVSEDAWRKTEKRFKLSAVLASHNKTLMNSLQVLPINYN